MVVFYIPVRYNGCRLLPWEATMKRNHHSLAYKRQAMPNKTYKD